MLSKRRLQVTKCSLDSDVLAIFQSVLFLFLKRDRKSSLVSRTSRQRRRSTPVSVRFADESALVQVIGPMEPVRRVGL